MTETMTALFAAGIGLMGAIVGGYFSYKGSKSASVANITSQNEMFTRNKELEELKRLEATKTSAKIIYLDLLTSIYEGFNVLKDADRPNVGRAPDLLPMHGGYSNLLVTLSEELDSDELILINKFYGVIEKIRYDILQINYVSSSYDHIIFDYNLLILNAFGNNFKEMMGLELSLITKDYITERLSPEVNKLFNKLRGIGNINQYGN
jgi:hypothetical protein